MDGIKFCKSYHPHGLLGYAVHLWICVLAVALFILFCVASASAQERFTVQSSGRGMENAKQAAQIRQLQVRDGQQDSRLDVVETDIEKIADHAWKAITQCGVGGGASGTGYKITWNPSGSGTWGCIQETDPTVKSFAKTDLPICGAGQVLRADGSKFICTTSSGTSGFEVDPYVQDFARNTAYTINACATDEILTMTSKRLRCVKSRDLSVTETDPTVQPFAKAVLPNCAAGQVLTTALNGSGIAVLRCVTDTDGGYAELDPSVGTINNSKWCMASGGKIHCNQNTPVLTEADPKVGTINNGLWCRGVSGRVVCDQAVPTGDNLGNHTATTSLNMGAHALTSNVGTLRDGSGGWVRTYGATGWYSQTYGGGWFMQDTTYLRAYNNKYIYTTGNVYGNAFFHTSDATMKKDIRTIDNPFGLLEGISGKRYLWKKSDQPSYGVIAQDVEKVMPEAVSRGADDFLMVDYDQLIAPLIEAVKQLKAENDMLSERIQRIQESLE